ncbi:hypothetical protein DFJ74DRAFT_771716 [Hyaloraphidium curvatum]|nr:hypothetical protein DFJ74DRAFT_771716 [Hyaloraphidium curvatum]
MGDAGPSRLALPVEGHRRDTRPSHRLPSLLPATFSRSALSLRPPNMGRSASYLDHDTSAWPPWKERWLVFDSDAQEDEYRANRMVPAYYKLFGIGSLMTGLVICIDVGREWSLGRASVARITVSLLAIVAYLAVVLHVSLTSPESFSKLGHKGRRQRFLFRHALGIWLGVAMLLQCLPEYLNSAKSHMPGGSTIPSTLGGYMPSFFILVIADYTGNGLLLPWNVLLGGVALVLSLGFSLWTGNGSFWETFVHLSPTISAVIIAWPSYYTNDRLQRLTYLNWIKLELKRTESVEAKSRLDNQLTLMFPPAILPALRADFESGNHGVIAKSIKSAAVMFVEFGSKQLKNIMLSSNVDEAARAVKILNCVFSEVDSLLMQPEFQQVHKIKTLGSKLLLAGGLFSSWTKGSNEPRPVSRRDSVRSSTVPDLVKCLHALYIRLYSKNVEIVDLLDVRAGMHVGPLVVGIVGNTRFYFDVYGDTINVSARLLDLTKPGELAFGEAVYGLLQPLFLESRCLGVQQIKGKGQMEIYVSDIESQGRKPSLALTLDPEPEQGLRIGNVTAFGDDVAFCDFSIFEFAGKLRSRTVGLPARLASRIRVLGWSALRRLRKVVSGGGSTWADSKSAYTRDTILTMPAEQYIGHLGSYLRRIPAAEVRPVLLGEMSGWLLKFRNSDLEGIYCSAKIHASHRSVLLTALLGLLASANQVFAAFCHLVSDGRTLESILASVEGGVFTVEELAVIWVVLGVGLQLLGLFWIWIGAHLGTEAPAALSGNNVCDLSRRPDDWSPAGAGSPRSPEAQAAAAARAKKEQRMMSLVRTLVLVCSGLGFALVHMGSLSFADLDTNYGYLAATMQLVAFFCVTIPMAGGIVFGEWQCVLAYLLVVGCLAWAAAVGRCNAFEGMQAALLASVSVVTSAINKRVEREDFLMQVVSAKHSIMTSAENERSLRFLECLVPAHVVPSLLSVPRKDVVERLDNETVIFMDICGFTKLSSMMEPYAVIRMLNAIFYEFDQIIQQAGCHMQKITTIGDAYVACTLTKPGAPETGGDSDGDATAGIHAVRSAAESALLCARTALAMQDKLAELHTFSWFVNLLRGNTVMIRMGLHTADVLGTVLGSRYELVGTGVAVAEKVQEGCSPGGVAVSERTWELLLSLGEGELRRRGVQGRASGRFVATGGAIRVVGERAEGEPCLECFELTRTRGGEYY